MELFPYDYITFLRQPAPMQDSDHFIGWTEHTHDQTMEGFLKGIMSVWRDCPDLFDPECACSMSRMRNFFVRRHSRGFIDKQMQEVKEGASSLLL